MPNLETLGAQLVRAALEAHPAEACGFVSRLDGGYVVHVGLNVHHDPTRAFALDDATLLALVRAGESAVALFHSHPAGGARESEADRGGHWRHLTQVIVSAAPGEVAVPHVVSGPRLDFGQPARYITAAHEQLERTGASGAPSTRPA